MRVLITGNLGYIGPVLVEHFRRVHPAIELVGYDAGFFAHCLTMSGGRLPETGLKTQHFGDVRELPNDLLASVDAVVHLAAVSNDPMGNRFEAVTEAINYRASVSLAERAAAAGVKTFVFASSCSVYGFAEGGRPRKETDPLNPLTAYARSKIGTEDSLREAKFGAMNVRCLRFATACGMSPRLRLDLVLNDFVACALSSHEISILSDGTPWRPLIDVADMARAIDWAVTASSGQDPFLAVNVGTDAWNYQVKDLANAVAKTIPGTSTSVNTQAPPDKRSYKVDFTLWKSVAPAHQPQVTLEQSIRNLAEGLAGIGFNDANFRNSALIRLKVLNDLLEKGLLDSDLRMKFR